MLRDAAIFTRASRLCVRLDGRESKITCATLCRSPPMPPTRAGPCLGSWQIRARRANHAFRVKPPSQKYFALPEFRFTVSIPLSAPTRGTFRDRHGTLGAGCDGRGNLRRNGLISEEIGTGCRTKGCRVRRSRVVLAPRPWRQAGGVICQRRWQKRPLTGESTK